VATPRSQRIGIWIIAIVMAVGTIGSFLIIILSTNNDKAEEAHRTALTNEYQAEYSEYQAKLEAQAAELSAKYFNEFNQYASRPSAFENQCHRVKNR
jgi:hypothetical protein